MLNYSYSLGPDDDELDTDWYDTDPDDGEWSEWHDRD